MPNLSWNLVVSSMNDLKMSSNCSASLALSHSQMLLISDACAVFFFQTCSSDRISLLSCATLRIPSALLFIALLSAVRLLLFCEILGTVTPRLI